MMTIPHKDSEDHDENDHDEVTMASFESKLLFAANDNGNNINRHKKKTKLSRKTMISAATKTTNPMILLMLLIIFFLLFFQNIPSTHAMGIGAYVYYEDAECINKNGKSYIHGTFVYAYDNSRMSGKGFQKNNYYGPCKYFDGGYYDFMYQSNVVSGSGSSSGSKNSMKSFMKTGYCATCHGMVGCTGTLYNCTDFQSMVPAQAYTLSSSSSSSSTSLSGYEEFAQEVEDDVYQEMSAASMSFVDESIFAYGLLGMVSGFTALMVLYAGTVGIKKMRRNKASKNIFVDKSEFLERRDDNRGHRSGNDDDNGRDGGNDHDTRDGNNYDDPNDNRINVGVIA